MSDAWSNLGLRRRADPDPPDSAPRGCATATHVVDTTCSTRPDRGRDTLPHRQAACSQARPTAGTPWCPGGFHRPDQNGLVRRQREDPVRHGYRCQQRFRNGHLSFPPASGPDRGGDPSSRPGGSRPAASAVPVICSALRSRAQAKLTRRLGERPAQRLVEVSALDRVVATAALSRSPREPGGRCRHPGAGVDTDLPSEAARPGRDPRKLGLSPATGGVRGRRPGEESTPGRRRGAARADYHLL